jgi:hypothetical protein
MQSMARTGEEVRMLRREVERLQGSLGTAAREVAMAEACRSACQEAARQCREEVQVELDEQKAKRQKEIDENGELRKQI